MAKDKAAKAVAKSGKNDTAKKSKTAFQAKAFVSEERVVDSDSDREAPKPAPKPAVKAAEKKRNMTAKSEQKEKKAKPTAAPPLPPPPPPKESSPSDSESDEEETDSDEEMPDVPVPKKPDSVPAKVNGVKRKADETMSSSSDNEDSEEEESSNEEESDQSEQPEAKRSKTASSEEESSDEETDEEEATKTPATTTSANIPVQPFKPPHGYSSLDVTSSMFSVNNFAGKQIWHITAPSNVPIKSITEVALDTIRSGAPVLAHKGTEYALTENKNHSNQFNSIMVPTTTGYELIPQKIAKSLHMQQKVQLPNLSKKQADISTGSNAAAEISQASIVTARPQPKGMRMRFKPSGFGAGNPGLGSESDEEEIQTKAKGKAFQFPKTLGAHGASEKPDVVETPKVKKLKKKRKDDDEEMVDADDRPQLPLRRSEVAHQPLEKATSKEGLNKGEKRKRKEEKREKRARKDAKANTNHDG